MPVTLPLQPQPHADPAADRADFARFLEESSLSADWVDQVSTNPHDQVPMPFGWSLLVANSPIHGCGAFALQAIGPGQVAAPARVGGRRTPAGRFVNHSANPNAAGVPASDDPEADVDLVALRPILPGEEITVDYRQSFRANRSLAQAARREQMTSLVAALMEHGDRTPPPVKHTLCNGMYMRELFIPAGMVLAGKVHRVACLNICSSGDIEIASETGLTRAGAGFTAVSRPFSQKLGYAYADTVWVNVFRTDLTDIAAIEREVFLDDEEMVAFLDPAGRHFHDYFELGGTP
jgi:hypothetical protein